jgi:hypothetical protein
VLHVTLHAVPSQPATPLADCWQGVHEEPQLSTLLFATHCPPHR